MQSAAVLLAIMVVLLAQPAAADFYTCKDAKGVMILRNSPCHNDEQWEKIEKEAEMEIENEIKNENEANAIQCSLNQSCAGVSSDNRILNPGHHLEGLLTEDWKVKLTLSSDKTLLFESTPEKGG